MALNDDLRRLQTAAKNTPTQQKGPDMLSFGLNMGSAIAGEIVKNELNAYQDDLKRVDSLGLGTEETLQKYNEVKDKYRYLSMLSPSAQRITKNITEYEKYQPLIDQATSDRVFEKMTVQHLNSVMDSIAKNGGNYEDFKKYMDSTKTKLSEEIKTGPSQYWNTTTDAISKYAQMTLTGAMNPEMARNRAEQYVNEAGMQLRNIAYNEGRPITEQELTNYMNAMEVNLGAASYGPNVIGNGLQNLLSVVGSPNLVEYASQKYAKYFNPKEIENLKDAALSTEQRRLEGPKQLVGLQKSMYANLNKGIYTPVDDSLWQTDNDAAFNTFLKGKAVNQLSPEQIQFNISNETEWSNYSSELNKIAAGFTMEFTEDPVQALINRGIFSKSQIGSISLPIYNQDIQDFEGMDQFESSLKSVTEHILLAKNSIYGGTEMINGVLTKEVKDYINNLKATKGLSSTAEFSLFNAITKVIDRANAENIESPENGTPISALNVVADLFGKDSPQVMWAAMARDNQNIQAEYSMYRLMKDNNSKIYDAGVSIISAGLLDRLGMDILSVPEQTRRTIAERGVVLSSNLQNSWFSKSAESVFKSGHGFKPATFENVYEIIEYGPKGARTTVAILPKGSKNLQSFKNNLRETIIINGVSKTINEWAMEGRIKIQNEPWSLTRFDVFYANDLKSAKAGNWIPMKDREGNKKTIRIIESN